MLIIRHINVCLHVLQAIMLITVLGPAKQTVATGMLMTIKSPKPALRSANQIHMPILQHLNAYPAAPPLFTQCKQIVYVIYNVPQAGFPTTQQTNASKNALFFSHTQMLSPNHVFS